VRNCGVPADTLTDRQLNRATLARQLLLAREPVTPVDAVERLCGMQAQEARPPFVGLWTRVDRFTRDDLHAAIQARDIVRVTLFRGTLHLTTAGDYAAQRAVIAPALAQGVRVLGDRAKGLDVDEVLPAARKLFAERPLTFNELRPLLVKVFPGVDDRALGYATRMHLPLVMVPTGDRWAFPSVASFTLADGWLGADVAGADPEPETLAWRYLAAFGPASAADAQTWSGVNLKAALDSLRPKLAVFRDERGRELFDLPDAPRPDPDTPAPVRFLPDFDNLVLAHADRARLLDDAHRPLVTTRNLRVRATFLVDGRVRGTWEIVRKRKVATLRLTRFGKLTKRVVTELTREGERLLRFVEDDATTYEVEAPDA
jgi:hypothetical protein